jgi:hypothetical protein
MAKCKGAVYTGRGGSHPCPRDATKDGYCWQHHPEDRKARRQRRYDQWHAEYDERRKRDAARDARIALALAVLEIVQADESRGNNDGLEARYILRRAEEKVKGGSDGR